MTTKPRRLVRGSFQNIIDCFNRADGESVLDGGVWYLMANSWAEVVGHRLNYYGHSMLPTKQEQILLGAGIIAAFSPQTNWDNNKTMAWRFAETLDKPDWCTDVNYRKAMAIVESGIISEHRILPVFGDDLEEYIDGCLGKEAFKTRAFFHNIVSPEGAYGPTIDRHAISIYLGKRCNYNELRRGLEGRANRTIRGAYMKASKILQVHHNQVQAITWVQWRKELKENK